jgi:hypothetical protein
MMAKATPYSCELLHIEDAPPGRITQEVIFSKDGTQDVSLFHAALFQQHSNRRHATLLFLVFKSFPPPISLARSLL